MKKELVLLGLPLVVLISLAGLALAHGSAQVTSQSMAAGIQGMGGVQSRMGMHKGMMGSDAGMGMMGANHQYMEEIIEEGTYDDLVKLREEKGLNIMPMIDSPEEFTHIQEMHEEMESMREEMGCPMR